MGGDGGGGCGGGGGGGGGWLIPHVVERQGNFCVAKSKMSGKV